MFINGFRKIIPKTKVYIAEDNIKACINNDKPQIVIGHRALNLLNSINYKQNILVGLVLSKIITKKYKNLKIICGTYLIIPPEITLPIVKKNSEQQTKR